MTRLFIGQATQPIQGAVQGFGQCDQGGNGGPSFPMLKISDGHITDPDHFRQGLFGPSVILADSLKAFAKKFFRVVVFHIDPNCGLEYTHITLTIG